MLWTIFQGVLALLLMIAILVQARGSSLGLAMGGDGNVYRTRRGVEKKLHLATVVLAVLFFGIGIARMILG